MAVAQVYLNGLGLGASLIMAIGAQNAHVLRMGIGRSHVAITVAACIAVDMLLIGAGLAGAGALIEASPLAMAVARWGGAAFLLWYGLRSWRGMFSSSRLDMATAAAPRSAAAALGGVLALSLLNPHVYLDTVVLLGAIGGRYPAQERIAFGTGAMTASLLWFTVLGFGAVRFSSVLARPLAWKCIEGLTGAVMFALACGLVMDGLAAT